METIKMEEGSYGTYACSYFQPVSPAVALGAGSSETSTRHNHSLPTTHLLHNIDQPHNYRDSIQTPVPIHANSKPASTSLSSLPLLATSSVCTSPMLPSTPKRSTENGYFSPSPSSSSSSSSSTSSSNFPDTPTPLPRHPTPRQNNANHYTWFRSTFRHTASQETESHHSDSSYCLSEQSNASSDLYVTRIVLDTMDRMDNTGNVHNNELSYAPPREPPHARSHAFLNDLANIDPRLLRDDANLAATNSMTTQSTAPPNVGNAANLDAIDYDENPYTKTFGEVSSQGNVVAHSSHNGGRADGSVHGSGAPRGRGGKSGGGTTRQAKRPRQQRDDEDDDEDIEGAPRGTKKRQKAAKEPEAQPVEIHRRFTSLRDRLIKGVNTPQNIGMRAYKNKQEAEAAAKAAAEAAQVQARIPPREFLVPIAQEQDPDRTLNFTQYGGNLHNVNNNHWTPIHPNLRIAYKSTPIHQLHFPEGLVLALKQNKIKWNSKPHSEGLVFVVTRIVDNDIADMHVFSALQDATVDALYMMVNEHPEAFAMPRELDDDGEELKPPRMERATSVIREITARPSFAQVPMSGTNPIAGGDPFAGTPYSHVQHTYYQGPSVQTASREVDTDGDLDAEGEDDDSLFVIKGETPELPRPSRIMDPQPFFNVRSEVLLGNRPEPAYMFWGKYKISSYCLKMEARRVDGAPIKVAVHLKNLRKPVHEY